VLLPALMVRAPLEGAARTRPPLRALDGCVRLARRPLVALAVVAAFVGIGALGVTRVEVATHDGEFFRPSHPINRAYRRLEARLGGVTPFEIEIAPAPGAALLGGPAVRAIRALQERVAQIPELTHGSSVADLLLTASPALRLDDDAEVERALFLVQAVAPAELERWLSREPPRARISARALAMTSARSEQLLAEVGALARETLPPGWSARSTGLVPVFSQMEQYLVEGQLASYGSALAGVGLVFLILCRSLPIALLGVFANAVPVLAAAAVMGLGGIRLDVATIMVASIALGIAVDDTIHLLQSYRTGQSRGQPAPQALRRAFSIAGRPMLITALILVSGFAVLTLSGFQPTAHFGLLVCVAVASALAGDLLILPAGLLWLDRLGRGAGSLAIREGEAS
jgi:predicted RND superfamily exporter protein